jgi:hypothetical protein
MGTLYTYLFDLWRSGGIIAKVHLNNRNYERNYMIFTSLFSTVVPRAFHAMPIFLPGFSQYKNRISLNNIQPTNYKL